MMDQESINKGLMNFIEESPTAFHAVSAMEKELVENGFTQLNEIEKWNLALGGKYYVKRNDSGLIAFNLTKGDIVTDGIRMVGGHTDSPALKVKPGPEIYFKDYLSLGVEPYGGLLLATWFDRDLSLAGKVSYLNKDGEIKTTLLNFNRAVAVVPSLAIHLDRKANDGRTINKQKDLPPVMLQIPQDQEEKPTFHSILQSELKSQNLATDLEKVLDFEMYFYDVAAPAFIGLNQDFIAAARIDNLASCYLGMKGLLNASDSVTSVLVCNDHEECGSSSTVGAAGPFLKAVLERITGGGEDFLRAMSNTILISADNAHAVHPNFADRHDANHGPQINQGPVIKINSNQRYATTAETSALFMRLCENAEVPYQKFVARSDMGCGSTIGPLSSTVLGVKTLDVGLPTFGMHSIRELMGVKDACFMYRVLTDFYA